MTVTELVKIFVTAWILSTTLQALGAAAWVVYACCFGMGFFWVFPKKSVDTESN